MKLDFHKWECFKECPKKFFMEHIKKEPHAIEYSDYPSLYGRTVERFFELFCNVWRFKTPYIFPDIIRERLVQIYEDQIKNSTIDWNCPKVGKTKEELFDLICSDVCAVMDSHNQNYFLNSSSEVTIDVALQNGHTITGRIDFVHGIPLCEEVVIIDGKGSSKIGKNVSNDQLYMYALLYYLKHKKMPAEIGFFYYRFNTYIPVPFNINILNEFRAKLSLDITKMTESTEYNPEPSAQACKFCHYFPICLEGQRSRAQRARESKIDIEGDGVVEFGL